MYQSIDKTENLRIARILDIWSPEHRQISFYGFGIIQKIQKIVGKVGLLALQLQRRDSCRNADVAKRWCPPPSPTICLQAAHVLVDLIFDALVARSLVVERGVGLSLIVSDYTYSSSVKSGGLAIWVGKLRMIGLEELSACGAPPSFVKRAFDRLAETGDVVSSVAMITQNHVAFFSALHNSHGSDGSSAPSGVMI